MIRRNSLRFRRNATYYPNPDNIAKRGKIRGFSDHAALRLRETLSKAHLPGSRLVGIRLSVPWLTDFISFDDAMIEYKACFHRFGVAFRRRFPNSACVFRHELQERKMPHTHLVCWLSTLDAPASIKSDELQNYFAAIWSSAVPRLFGGSLTGFVRNGVHLDHVDNNHIALFRYLCDHISKHKQAQLGYQGKQWGTLNKALFVPDYEFSAELNPEQLVLISRQISRASRYSYQLSDPKKANKRGHEGKKKMRLWKWKKCSRRNVCGVVFLNIRTSAKLIKYYGASIKLSSSCLDFHPLVYEMYFNAVLSAYERGDLDYVRSCTFPRWLLGVDWFTG